MLRNRRVTAVGVLSLLATIMTALALTVTPPIRNHKQTENDMGTGVLSETDAVLNSVSAGNSIPIDKPVATDEDKEYLIKEVSGFLGIFLPEDTENPQLITGIAISKLREADARMFKEGIIVKGEEELARLLEDFGS